MNSNYHLSTVLNRMKRFSHLVVAATKSIHALLIFIALSSCGRHSTELEYGYWSLSTPEEQNMDGGIINNLSIEIKAGTYGQIHSLLILRHGYLVFEEYYNGYDQNDIHPVYSVTKSITSCLIGIAMDQGKITDFPQPILTFFPEYSSISNIDSNKLKITIEDLLTMKSGFQWDESSYPYGDPRNPTYALAVSSDWIKFMLDLPMSHPPGERFRYNSGCSILLSGILRNRIGTNAEMFCLVNLFDPLGIDKYQWQSGPHEITNTGWGLSIRPRDMAKLGILYLRRGMFEESRIISEGWIEESMTKRVSVRASFGYGYQWWFLPIDFLQGYEPKPNDIQFAWGYGGQFVFVIPAFDLVVVSTAGNYQGNTDELTIKFLKERIIKAISR